MKNVNNDQKRNIQQDYASNSTVTRKRLLLLFAFFMVAALMATGYTGYIQLVKAKDYNVMSMEQQNRDRTIKAERGNILDSSGTALAISVSVDTISASPVLMQENSEMEVSEIAKGLSEILGTNYETLYLKLSTTTQYQLIASKVDKKVGDLVKQYVRENKIYGIYFQQDTKRYYPYGTLCAHAIGFVGSDNQGLYGLELSAERYLKGTDGKLVDDVDVLGIQLPFNSDWKIDAIDGYDVVTTLNIDIQQIAEKITKQAMHDNSAQGGAVCIVADSKTSEILAMVSDPGFNLNDPRALPAGYDISGWTGSRASDVELLYSTVWRNKAIMDTYEPGSTFKSITSAIALEQDMISLDSIVDDFPVTVSGATIHCWSKEYPHGKETFLQAVYNSCNPVFVKISHTIGVKTFYKYIEAFGLKDDTGIELYGEGQSIFHESPTVLDMSVASFGQRFQITPLQLITAYNAIANGGHLIQPSIIDKVVDKQGNIVQDFTPEIKINVISTETSDLLRQVLEGVVREGGGKNAYSEGWRIAGKTGTSETTEDDVYISSFIGFAPADNPVITVLLIVYNPQGESYYGSQVAAPYAKLIFEQSLEVLGVQRSGGGFEKDVRITVPNLTGFNIKKAAQKLKDINISYIIEGSTASEDSTVMYQYPVSGTEISSDGVVILYTYIPDDKKTVKMPDLTGKEKSYVINTLKDLGLNVNSDGNGSCISMQYATGTAIEIGSVVNITFRYTDYLD